MGCGLSKTRASAGGCRVGAPSDTAATVVASEAELLGDAFFAPYYWSTFATRGFGPYSSSYRCGAHPGYRRATNYYADLDDGHGNLVDHPSALWTIVAESEAHVLATLPNLVAVHRTEWKDHQVPDTMDWTAKTTVNAPRTTSPRIAEELVSVNDPATGKVASLESRNSDGDVEHYALDGRLIGLTTRDGRHHALTHTSQQRVRTVTDETRRLLRLGYSGEFLAPMTLPTGEVLTFTYDEVGNLTEIVYPDDTPADDTDNPPRTYHYEEARFPHCLTGITGGRDVRVATTYGDQGRAIASRHAGGADHYGLVYNVDGSTTVTDSQGPERTYWFVTQHRLTQVASVTGRDCSSCGQDAASYTDDASGFLARKTDFKGSVTTYIRDAPGRKLIRTEAAGTLEARTITTTWHPHFNKPPTIEAPGRAITFSYDTVGQLVSRQMQSATPKGLQGQRGFSL